MYPHEPRNKKPANQQTQPILWDVQVIQVRRNSKHQNILLWSLSKSLDLEAVPFPSHSAFARKSSAWLHIRYLFQKCTYTNRPSLFGIVLFTFKHDTDHNIFNQLGSDNLSWRSRGEKGRELFHKCMSSEQMSANCSYKEKKENKTHAILGRQKCLLFI